MTHYFVEYSSITNSYIVHRERCITYPNLDLTAMKKMDNIGVHGDDSSALNEARKLYRDPCACYCCFFRHYHDAVLATVGISRTKTSVH